jgi:hypothetical protein
MRFFETFSVVIVSPYHMFDQHSDPIDANVCLLPSSMVMIGTNHEKQHN